MLKQNRAFIGFDRGRVRRAVDPRKSKIQYQAKRARYELALKRPLLSARKPAGRLTVVVILLMTLGACLGVLHIGAFASLWTVTCYVFAAIGLVRASACLNAFATQDSDHKLCTSEVYPIWTILIALYKEADSVPSLLSALSALDWPKNRLDIIFACESDDEETLRVLEALQKTHRYRIVRVPAGGPRTKPNALQTALPFAIGRYLTVYDAEDRPDSAQLKAAYRAFLGHDHRLAVVQAPLVAWNHRESWISQQFALDYAIWFRVLLPAFSRLSGLIPLGGTSNHFNVYVLRKVGGWDPYNVTEDADLGVRLARFGFKTCLIAPPTYEEAPPKIGAWVKQRGRWIQGHIQTFSLHMRRPAKLYRDLGVRGVLAFFLGIGNGPLAALMMMPFALGIALAFASDANAHAIFPMCIFCLGHVVVGLVAIQRDGRWELLPALITLPLYHVLQFAAACRALWRVAFTPTIWDKTEHGCAARIRQQKCVKRWDGRQLSLYLE